MTGVQTCALPIFQDVLFTVDIGERVVVHRLLKVDRIQDPDLIAVLLQGMAAFQDDGSLCQGSTARRTQEILVFRVAEAMKTM